MVGLIAIDGSSDCPDAAAVARELRPLAVTQPARIELRHEAGALVIEQRSPGGERLATRRLALGPSCADLAAAAAVVIASWQTSLPGGADYDAGAGAAAARDAAAAGARVRNDAPAAPPANAHNGAVAGKAAPAGPGNAAPAGPGKAAPVAPAGASSGAAAVEPGGPSLALARPAAARRLAVEVGGAFVASFAPDFAPGAAVDALFAPGGGRWAARLGVSGSGTRDLGFAGGTAAWTRFGLELGPALRLARGRWRLVLHAEAVAGLLYVAGHGYDRTRTALSFDPGLGGGVRGAVRLGPVAPFIGVGVVGWLRPEVVALNGAFETRSLPAVELLLNAGLSIGNFR